MVIEDTTNCKFVGTDFFLIFTARFQRVSRFPYKLSNLIDKRRSDPCGMNASLRFRSKDTFEKVIEEFIA